MANDNNNPPRLKLPSLGDSNQDQRDNQPYIIDLVTKEILFLQTIPLELEVNPETSWATVSAPGRNLPLYQYTGAEDSISFVLSWYANTASKEDPLKKCKWLEALSKNNGYDEKPHRVKFIFGTLFSRSTWIVFSAKYKLSLYDRSKGMMPCMAVQEVILKRISDKNPLRSDILKLDT